MRQSQVKADQTATDSPLISNRLTGPIQFLNKLLNTWNIGPKEAVYLLGFERSSRQHVEKLLNGTVRLEGRDVKDRIVYLFEIRSSLSALFMDEAAENQWIREPQPLLDDQVPLQLMLEGVVELMVLLHTRNVTESLKELLNKSFRQRLNQKNTKVTRFSDGSYPVFYGALEKETAKAEITCHIPKYLKNSGG